MKKNIILTGFMGAGKSAVGKRLEAALQRRFASTDELIEKHEKRPITDIFRDSGEAYFRDVESEAVRQLSALQGLVVDCGGGVVLRDENMQNLKKNGIVFYLSATPEILYQRVKGKKHRPLLNVDDPEQKIRELLATREPCYRRADHVIDTSDKTVEQVVAEIIALVRDE